MPKEINCPFLCCQRNSENISILNTVLLQELDTTTLVKLSCGFGQTSVSAKFGCISQQDICKESKRGVGDPGHAAPEGPGMHCSNV